MTSEQLENLVGNLLARFNGKRASIVKVFRIGKEDIMQMAEDVRARHFDAAAASGQRPLLILGPEAELEHSSLQFLCEFLPRSQDIVRATGERPDTVLRYRMTRLNLIFDKWDVAQCRWIGVSAAEIVEAWTAEKTAERRDILFSPAH